VPHLPWGPCLKTSALTCSAPLLSRLRAPPPEPYGKGVRLLEGMARAQYLPRPFPGLYEIYAHIFLFVLLQPYLPPVSYRTDETLPQEA